MNFKLNFKDKYVDSGPTETENLEPIVNFRITYTKAKVCFFLALSLEKQDLKLHRAVTHSLLLYFIKFFYVIN
jgi:hypothetical protein